MSRRRSFTLRRLFACATLSVAITLPGAASAQRGIVPEAAVFLLLPVGARSVASGQSVAGEDPGAEMLFWNPAAVAHATHSDFAFNYGKFFVGPLVALNLVKPLGRAGVVGATVGVLDYGAQDNTDSLGTHGRTSQQAYILAATYSATLGRHAALGLTFKSAQFVANCSGLCDDLAKFHVSSSAVDVGLQLRFLKEDDLIVAAAVRHLGLSFQVNDAPQADPMPSRIQLGVGYRLRTFDDDLQGAQVHLSVDLIDRLLDPGSVAPRFGVRVDWKDLVGVRAGYVVGSGEGTGIGVGVGVVAGHIGVDIAKTLGTNSDVTDGTTYLSVRYRW